MTAADTMRVGIGFDAHAFAAGRRLVLAGVEIPAERGLAGHSDADLVSHAVTDALLGAAGMEDIGHLFPSDDPALRGAREHRSAARGLGELRARGWELVNVDAIVIMQAPRLAPHRDAMRAALATALAVDTERVTVRASTTDHLGLHGPRRGRRLPGRRAAAEGAVTPVVVSFRPRRDPVGVHADDGRLAGRHHRRARAAAARSSRGTSPSS